MLFDTITLEKPATLRAESGGKMYLEIRKKRGYGKKWYVLIKSDNHEIMFASENYFSKDNAMRAATNFQDKLGMPLTIKVFDPTYSPPR